MMNILYNHITSARGVSSNQFPCKSSKGSLALAGSLINCLEANNLFGASVVLGVGVYRVSTIQLDTHVRSDMHWQCRVR